MLRYYQQDAIAACYRYLEQHTDKNPCIVLPTGAGKTHVIAQMCCDVAMWGGRVLLLAHVKELLEQAREKLLSCDSSLDVGVYSASLNSRDTRNRVIVAGVQSAYKRGLELCGSSPFSLVLIDEAHRIPLSGEGMYQTLLGDLKTANPKMRVVGLTATPYRTGQGYVCQEDHFLNDICYEANILELIAGGYLCRLVSKRSRNEIDTSTLTISKGEFAESEMESAFVDKVDAAIEEVLRLTKDRKSVLVFCCGIQHASEVAYGLDAAGESVRIVSSQHSNREKSIEDFKSGKAKYLVNINVLTEGFDATRVDCVVLLRATCSPGLYYQMVGRGLRIDDEKDNCLVLDFGENIKRHGTIDALNIKALSGKAGEGEAPVKACPQCDAMIHAGLMICSDCGYEFPPPEVKHEATASEESVLAETQVETVKVASVSYTLHKKRDNPEAPRSIRVTYYGEPGAIYPVCDEWVCVEHSGYAYEKAFAWWTARTDKPMPATAEDAVSFAQRGGLAEPIEITIKTKPTDKWPTITSYKLGEAISSNDVADEDDWVAEELGEVPF